MNDTPRRWIGPDSIGLPPTTRQMRCRCSSPKAEQNAIKARLKEMANIASRMIAVIAVCASTACSSPSEMRESLVVSEKTFLTIANGTSLDDARKQLGIAARHEFTVAAADGTYILLGCQVEPEGAQTDAGGELFLLFHDNRLIKIVKPVRLPQKVETETYNGHTVRVSRSESWDIEGPVPVTKTIAAPALTPAQISEYLKPYTGPGSEPLSLVPAAAAVAPLAIALAPATLTLMEKEYAMNQDLFKRYDGCLAKIGMTRDQVESLYGKPLQIFSTKGGGAVRIFGCSGEFPLVDAEGKLPLVDPDVAFNKMAVVTDAKGQVSAIYSNDFFCDDWEKGGLAPDSIGSSQK